MERPVGSHLTWAVFAAVAIVLLATAAIVPAESVWVTDCGNRIIQAESLLASEFESIAIAWPGRAIDPDLRHFPAAGFHFLRRGGEVVSFYSPVYPAVISLPLAIGGTRSVLLLSALAALAALALTAALARRLGASDAGAAFSVAILGLTTPLWFYAAVIWEHTLSIALSTAGVLILTRRSGAGTPPKSSGILAGAALAGAAVAASTWLREEGYVAALALAIGTLAAERRAGRAIAFSAMFTTVMLPLWVLNVSWSGSPLGTHAVIYDAMRQDGGIVELALRLGEYLARSHPSPAVSAALTLPAIGIAAAGLRPMSRRVLLWLLPLAGLAAAAVALWLHGMADPVRGTLWTQGLLVAMPWVAVALAVRERSEPWARLTWAIAIGVIVTPLLLHRSAIGVIWGPRHFLWMAPPAAAMAAAGLARLRQTRVSLAAIAVLVAATALLQAEGIRILRMKTGHGARVLAALEATSGPVVTDVFWLPEELAAIWMERPVFYAGSDEELRQFQSRLRANEIATWTLVLSRTERRLSHAILADLLERATRRTQVAAEAATLDLMLIEIADPAARDVSEER